MSRSALSDVAGGALIAVLGLAIALVSRDFTWFGEGGRVGSGLVAGFSGLIMAVLGVVIAAKPLLRGGDTTSADPERPAPEPAPPVDQQTRTAAVPAAEVGERPRELRSTLGVLLATLAAIFLTPMIGFLAAFALLLFFVVVFIEGASLRVAAVFTGVTIGVTWLVFVYALNVPLPTGLFGPR